jgi:hypothetical protein
MGKIADKVQGAIGFSNLFRPLGINCLKEKDEKGVVTFGL